MVLDRTPEMLVVSEIDPSTVVGDGPMAGWRCASIRLGGCNLACTWCDVPYAWDGSRYDLALSVPRRLVRNILEEALVAAPRLVLVTGGEPLLQQRLSGFAGLLRELGERGHEVELHTNGTLAPNEIAVRGVHRFVVSPKLGHSGEPTWSRLQPEALAAWSRLATTGQVAFSFVVRDPGDVQTVATLCAVHHLPHDLVWVSPEGTTPLRTVEVVANVAPAAVAHGFNIAQRVLGVSSGVRTAVA